MRIFLAGVSCVGKTTVGARLSGMLGRPFFDLDQEVERFFGTSIERLQRRFPTMERFRKEAAKVLAALLARPESEEAVIALPPSGLMGPYLAVVKRAGGIRVALTDTPENILARIRFCDIDSQPIEKDLTESEKRHYLREIKKDIAYFGRSFKRADLEIDLAGLNADGAAEKVRAALKRRGVLA